MDWKWAKANEKAIASFATDKARDLFDLKDISSFDLRQDGNIEALLKSLYDALVSHHIPYEVAKISASEAIQPIRSPVEVLERPKYGTCLDLALLFCGLCLGCNLLPKLVMLSGHALVAVPLELERKDYRKSGKSQKEFWREPKVFTDEELLKELIDDQDYCIIECTGFSYSESMAAGSTELPPEFQRDEAGYLSFEQAQGAGRAQLDRLKFLYAVDIEVAHQEWGIEPADFEIPAGWEKQAVRKVVVDQKVEDLSDTELVGAKATGESAQGDFEISQDVKKATNSVIIGWSGDA